RRRYRCRDFFVDYDHCKLGGRSIRHRRCGFCRGWSGERLVMTDNARAAAPLTRQAIEAKIVALAWQNDDFRHKFVADAKGQFEERLGTKLPASLKMTVHEENENSLHFVIPMKPKTNLSELSDEELEKVAGGTDIVSITIITSIVGAALGTGLA